ncbi:MAG: hypothetical protein ACRD6N_00740 [Pyrinomonadaceae bacterium]
MKNELRLLNLFCFVAAVFFIALAILNALFSGQFLTTDNLFITMVCLVMALMFAANPILQLRSEGRLPIPFKKRLAARQGVQQVAGTSSPPLLDAKGRAVPPDVKAIVANMQQVPSKD